MGADQKQQQADSVAACDQTSSSAPQAKSSAHIKRHMLPLK
jgi:hypothetical protein